MSFDMNPMNEQQDEEEMFVFAIAEMVQRGDVSTAKLHSRAYVDHVLKANPSDGPLVAVAPELLEACKVAVAALKMPSGNGIGTEIAIENIVRIIAKAEGK